MLGPRCHGPGAARARPLPLLSWSRAGAAAGRTQLRSPGHPRQCHRLERGVLVVSAAFCVPLSSVKWGRSGLWGSGPELPRGFQHPKVHEEVQGSAQGEEVLSPALRMLCEGWVTSVLLGTRLLAVGCLFSAPCAPASRCQQSPALFFLEGELSPGCPWESVLGRLQPASPSLRPAAGLFWGRSRSPRGGQRAAPPAASCTPPAPGAGSTSQSSRSEIW